MRHVARATGTPFVVGRFRFASRRPMGGHEAAEPVVDRQSPSPFAPSNHRVHAAVQLVPSRRAEPGSPVVSTQIYNIYIILTTIIMGRVRNS